MSGNDIKSSKKTQYSLFHYFENKYFENKLHATSISQKYGIRIEIII